MSADAPTAPAGAPPQPKPQTPSSHAHAHEGGYRDTVESILIAFILAFIFRAFVVEAFVIPTGSMAPTLLGAHARFTCDDCGYEFEANFSSPGGEDQNIAAQVDHSKFPTPQRGVARSDLHVDCPNCAHVVHDPNDGGNKPVPIHYGDRILVLKYAYLFQEPARWDVVVFKSPDEPTPPGSPYYTTNFIKRLVGRPNETLMILDGDVYVSPTAPQPPASGSDEPILPNDFKVQSKPRHVQEALWRIVCDGDFVPRQRAWQPWIVEDGAGWDIGTPDNRKRVFTFDGASGATGTIRFDNDFNNRRAFTDFLAYAQHDSGKNNVSDIKLSALYHRTQGEGPLRLRLTKRDDTFTAELTPGVITLYRKRGGISGPDDVGERIAFADKIGGLAGGAGPVRVEFQNVDHVVTVRVGDVDVLSKSYDPDVAALRDAYAAGRNLPKPEVRITASEQACKLSHVSLWRDVYYTTDGPQIRWAKPGEPIRLGAHEYFVLGDNTVISKDARYWTEPISLPAEDLKVGPGRVPERFLLGKAFFVYWPAGYRPFGSAKSPGLIPNFGDMRFIH